MCVHACLVKCGTKKLMNKNKKLSILLFSDRIFCCIQKSPTQQFNKKNTVLTNTPEEQVLMLVLSCCPHNRNTSINVILVDFVSKENESNSHRRFVDSDM